MFFISLVGIWVLKICVTLCGPSTKHDDSLVYNWVLHSMSELWCWVAVCIYKPFSFFSSCPNTILLVSLMCQVLKLNLGMGGGTADVWDGKVYKDKEHLPLSWRGAQSEEMDL
jgi:hypothetical protein